MCPAAFTTASASLRSEHVWLKILLEPSVVGTPVLTSRHRSIRSGVECTLVLRVVVLGVSTRRVHSVTWAPGQQRRLTSTGGEAETHGRGWGQRQRDAGEGNRAGGDLGRRGLLVNIEAGGRTQAKIMGVCLWGQNTKSWAFSETGVWSFCSVLGSDWRFQPSYLVRSLHSPEHSSLDLSLRLILGASAAGSVTDKVLYRG